MLAFLRRYLVLKVGIIVLCAVLLGFAASAAVSSHLQIQSMERMHRASASFLANGLAAGVRHAMLSGNGTAVRELLEDAERRIQHAKVKVYAASGEEVFTAKSPPPAPEDVAPHVRKALAIKKFHRSEAGQSVYPIPTEKRCKQCHEGDGLRGVLTIDTDHAEVKLDGSDRAQAAMVSVARAGFVQVMAAEQEDHLDEYFAELARRTPGIAGVAVYDAAGEHYFGRSDLALDAATLTRALQPGPVITVPRGDAVIHLLPLENEARCQGCHDADEPMRGALAILIEPEEFADCYTIFNASVTSLNHIMMSGLGRLGVQFLDEVANTGAAASLTLHDADGRLVHDAFAEHEPPPMVAKALRRLESAMTTVIHGDSEAFVYVDPLRNEPRCQTCHGTEKELRGAISISLDTTEAARERRSLRRQTVTYAGATVALVVILLFFGLRITVLLPVKAIGAAAERIGDGDLDVQVELGSVDEIGRLAERINGMVLGLRKKLELSKFVSRATVDRVDSHVETMDGKVIRSGKRKRITVLFSDIRGFTAFAETRQPEEVVEMLNAYLQVQSKVVAFHGGDIDKFVGDELMARFDGPDQETRAVRAAIGMLEAVQQLNEDRALSMGYEVGVGIGVNVGGMVIGAMGSEDRMDFTVIGDEVNLGARLCSAAEPGQVLVSQGVHDAVASGEGLQLDALDPIQVKGKSDLVAIFSATRSAA